MPSDPNHFVLRAMRTEPVGECNDDACGSNPQRLWVLDGATGVSDHRWTRLASDASWLAHAASSLLAEPRWDGKPLDEVLSQLEEQLKAAFAAEVDAAGAMQASAQEMPSACLGLVQLLPGSIELACVGDISIAVQAPGQELQVYTDAASQPFGQRTLHAWQRARASTHDAQARWEDVRQVIRENRQAMNRPDGYRVVHPVPGWADGVAIHRLPRVEGTRILLASDGLWRLVDLFGDMTPHALLQFVAEQGVEAALVRLRSLEEADPGGDAFPRVKRGDDATGLLAELASAKEPAP